MGFFNKILNALGFEDEEESPKPKIKEKRTKTKAKVVASYDLDKYAEEEQSVQEEKEQEVVQENPQLDFELVKVKSQVDVQRVVQKIVLGNKILINTEGLEPEDLTRSLDFLSGAVYALNLTMQKVDDYLFLISKK